MAMRAGSSLIACYGGAPLAGSSSFRRLPFSTDSPEFPNSEQNTSHKGRSNKVSIVSAAEDRASYPNIGDKIHNDIASYSNEVAPIPSRFPFDLKAHPGSTLIIMEGRYHKERIQVCADPLDIENPVNGDGPCLPLMVTLRKGHFHVTAYMTAKPNQLHILSVTMRNYKTETETTEFSEYFKSVGITPKTISFLYDRLGYSRRNA